MWFTEWVSDSIAVCTSLSFEFTPAESPTSLLSIFPPWFIELLSNIKWTNLSIKLWSFVTTEKVPILKKASTQLPPASDVGSAAELAKGSIRTLYLQPFHELSPENYWTTVDDSDWCFRNISQWNGLRCWCLRRSSFMLNSTKFRGMAIIQTSCEHFFHEPLKGAVLPKLNAPWKYNKILGIPTLSDNTSVTLCQYKFWLRSVFGFSAFYFFEWPCSGVAATSPLMNLKFVLT